MRFFDCPICKLSLPKTMAIPVIVMHEGREVKILICYRCKERKEREAKEVK